MHQNNNCDKIKMKKENMRKPHIMWMLSVALLLCLPILETKRVHDPPSDRNSHNNHNSEKFQNSHSRNDISETTQKNYLTCADDSVNKHRNFSYPGKEIICENLQNIGATDIIKPTKNVDKVKVIQFIAVNGSLNKKLLRDYQNSKTILIYKSFIDSFLLGCDNNQELIIADSVFPPVTRDIFQKAKSIHLLAFYSNPGLVLEDLCFSDLKHLKSLTIYNQSLPILSNVTLSGLKKLTRLVLVEVGLTEVESSAFEHTRHLKELILDQNPLEHFIANYSQLKRLRKLSLINTNLKKFGLPLFNHAKKLHVLGIPNRAWTKVTIMELALTFPRLHTAIVNLDEQGSEDISELVEEMEASGLLVEKVNKPSILKDPIFQEDVEILSWQ